MDPTGAAPAPDPARLTRRRLLVLGAASGATVLLAGCDTIGSLATPPSDTPSSGPASRSPASSAADADDAAADTADTRLAAEVVALSVAAAAALRGLADGAPRPPRAVRERLSAAAGAHDAHADALRGAMTRAARSTGRLAPRLVDPARGAGSLRSARRVEELAGAGLQQAVAEAESGPFARLLAGMAASSAQHAQLLAASGRGR